MKLSVDKHWRVDASHSIRLPLPTSIVWGQMRDLKRFVTIDPLHKRVRAAATARRSAIPCQGESLVIEHRFLGFGPDRLSRVLRWREGRGYAISDLSRRGVHVGFPHVCVYDVELIDAHTSRLTIAARGRWTATYLPRPVIKFWLWWVMRSTAARIETELLALTITLRRQHLRCLQNSRHDSAS